jgi:hypothetical protein
VTDDGVFPIARGHSDPDGTAARLLLDFAAEEARLQSLVRLKRDEAIRNADAAGISVSKIAVRVGLTRSRIYQIIKKGER